jgi:nucleoside-diphosphate-sugar epimerase
MILVTGAGGFIGRQVCQLLSTHGLDVLAFDQNFPSPPPCQAVQGDIGDHLLLTRLFQEHTFKVIIHLAAVLNTASRLHPEEAMRVNIGSSLALLALAIQFNCTRFIFGSSITAYGCKPYHEDKSISEAEPAAPDNVYGVSKRFIEVVGEQYHFQKKIQFAALRIGMVVGAGAKSTTSRWRSEIFEALQAVEPVEIRLPFARPEHLPMIHVADVAACIHALIASQPPLHTIYNTPCDTWQCGDLADTLQSLNPHITVTFSPPQARGDPEAIDGSRFIEEFGIHPLPIKERLHQA